LDKIQVEFEAKVKQKDGSFSWEKVRHIEKGSKEDLEEFIHYLKDETSNIRNLKIAWL